MVERGQLEKVRVSAQSNFLSVVGAVLRCGRGGIIIHLKISGEF